MRLIVMTIIKISKYISVGINICFCFKVAGKRIIIFVTWVLVEMELHFSQK